MPEADHSPHLMLRLTISLAVPPLNYAFMSCRGTALSVSYHITIVAERGDQTGNVNRFVSIRRGEGRSC